MNYTIGIVGVIFIQLAVSLAVILAGTGNGSFVGLAAMLFAIIGIPATALINFLIIRQHRNNPKRANITWLISISSILPALQIALLIAQKVFQL